MINKIVLASKSKVRKKILEENGISCIVEPANIDEDLVKKIDSFLKSLKAKNKKEAINSIDISDKKKCFVIKIKNKYENYYFEEIGGTFFAYVKKLQNINSVDIYADSLNENKDKLAKFLSKFIFGFNLKSYTFNKYKTLN